MALVKSDLQQVRSKMAWRAIVKGSRELALAKVFSGCLIFCLYGCFDGFL